MKRIIIVGCIVLIVLISLLPFPQKIERTFYGVNTSNGEKATINLNIKYLRFLFLKDNIYGKITVTSENETITYGKHLQYSGLCPSNNENEFHAFSGWYLNNDTYTRDYGNGISGTDIVGFEPTIVYLSRDFDKILLLHNTNGKTETHKAKRYIGNVSENQEDETAKYFTGFYE